MKKRFIVMLTAALAGLAVTAAEITVKPAELVISMAPGNEVACEEMKTHLKLVTGVDVPVVATPDNGFVLYLGKARAGQAAAPGEARYDITDKGIYFYGSTLNAVYDFLENELGIRWPSDNDIAYKAQNELKFSTGEHRWEPPFPIRVMRSRAVWGRRMRLGKEPGCPVYGHAFHDWWAKYGKTHPEYFALNSQGVRAPFGGKRTATDNQILYTGAAEKTIKMCVSQPKVVEQIIANWDKKSPYINICENDSDPKEYCSCPQCCALDAELPAGQAKGDHFFFTDRYIYFANAVLAAARKIRPDAKVVMYAYLDTEQPPAREKLSPGIVVGLVTTDFTVEGTRKLIDGWQKAGMTEYFWRPNQHHYFATGFLPQGNEKHFYEIMQTIIRPGCLGFDFDAPPKPDTSVLFADYVMAKVMQDPSKPFEYWEKDYLRAFGEAAEDIGNYYRYWRNNWERKICPNYPKIMKTGRYTNFTRGLMWGELKNCFLDTDFETTDKFLADALAENLSPEEKARVEALMLANKHGRLVCQAVIKKNEASVELLKFRQENKLQVLPPLEKYWGDPNGINVATAFSGYTPPFLRGPLFWFFKLDRENVGMKEEWFKLSYEEMSQWTKEKEGSWMPIDSPWEAPKRFRAGQPTPEFRKVLAQYDGIAWYGYRFMVPHDWKDREVFLYFGAVDESCWVWLNNQFVGEHLNDWNTPFFIPITDAVKWNTADPHNYQTVTVRVEDTAGNGGIWKPIYIVSRKK